MTRQRSLTAARNAIRNTAFACLATLAMCAIPGIASAQTPAAMWPCIQPKVAELSPGQMWAGPPLDATNWRDDPAVADLVPVLVARRTSLDAVPGLLDKFAAEGGDKNKRLTLLFTGVFDQISTQRTRIMTGIERYAKHQVDLSDRIKDESLKLSQAKKAAATDQDKAAAKDMETRLLWDTRIYDTRTQAMNAVCESPVILEQRAFALAREIQNHME